MSVSCPNPPLLNNQLFKVFEFINILFDNVVVPDTFNDEMHVVELFKVVDDATFKVPVHETLPLSTVKTSAIISAGLTVD